MLTLATKITAYCPSHRITHFLLYTFTIPSNNRYYHYSSSSTTQSQFSNPIVSFHSWKLTHQPREPTLHWNLRFRQQQNFDTEEQEEKDQSSENWDSWFQQQQQLPSLLSFSRNQLSFFDPAQHTSMPKRQTESSSSPNISIKRKKYSDCKISNSTLSFDLKTDIF